MATRTIDDCIDDLISGLDFDDVIIWANALGVEVNYPPLGDLYPDWQDELAVEVGEELLTAITFSIHEELAETKKVSEEMFNYVGGEPSLNDDEVLLDWANRLKSLLQKK